MTQQPNNTPTAEELELINAYARNPLSAEQVYCFNLTLCDNEVDRDFERFSVDGLKALCELFKGKTGIADHNMSSQSQKARIFKTWLEQDSNKKTSVGESYVALRAKAYMLRTEENAEMIAQIEGGIKKEVSVGCSMKSLTCSICSKSMKTHECNHIKGKYYGKKLCYGILDDASDAYEWSFVAVPAQKNAGVTKAFTKTQNEGLKTVDCFSENKVKGFPYTEKQLKVLEKEASEGRMYKEYLVSEIRKFAMIALPCVKTGALTASCEGMDINELKDFMHSLKIQASGLVPVEIQLRPLQDKKNYSDNNDFKI